jgi:16S rRNA (adenine1518-N6/adenine1519-N6)-dimethyltransferase
VLEIGAGLGSLTLPLAATGAEVVAVEVDRAAVAALEEVVGGRRPEVRVLHADAMRLAWTEVLGPGDDPWVLCANLPYNIATPLVLDVLEDVPRVRRLVVMVQREVAQRLAAAPGDEGFGAVSLHVTYAAEATMLRRVAPTVFWPRPGVDSAIVRIERRAVPPVDVEPARLWRVVDEAFAQRRKTMRNALRRLGLGTGAADEVLTACDVPAAARPEELGLEAFARIAAAVPA